MNIILLSGGSGKRLWPLSNDIRSKQFIPIFKKEDGSYESMVQRIYGQIKSVDPEANITIATAKTQVSAITNQLGNGVGISVEPCRRDTFAAIVVPQNIERRTPLVEITMEGIAYLLNYSMSFRPGYQHTITVTLNSSPEQEKIEIQIDGEVTDWE